MDFHGFSMFFDTFLVVRRSCVGFLWIFTAVSMVFLWILVDGLLLVLYWISTGFMVYKLLIGVLKVFYGFSMVFLWIFQFNLEFSMGVLWFSMDL